MWDKKAKKTLNISDQRNQDFSILAQWTDTQTGTLYLIVAHYDRNREKSQSTIYAISKEGALIAQNSVEESVILDKISYNIYCPGLSANYLDKVGDLVYLSYQDKSQKGVLCYDVVKQCFVKQIITGFDVIGIQKDHIVGVIDQKLILASIPEGDEVELVNGMKLMLGACEIKEVYQLPKYKKIAVNEDYIYLLTKKLYMRFQPGGDTWKALADVSSIFDTKGPDTYIMELVAKDRNHFSIVYYGDCGAEYYVSSYVCTRIEVMQ